MERRSRDKYGALGVQGKINRSRGLRLELEMPMKSACRISPAIRAPMQSTLFLRAPGYRMARYWRMQAEWPDGVTQHVGDFASESGG
jgi:hypothetical protein